MKLFIKNNLVSLRGNSFVVDEEGNQVFKIKGKFFTVTNKKRVYDMDDNLLYVIRDKYWKFFSTSCFVFDADREKIAKLSNSDWDFKNKFKVLGYKDEIVISGNLSKWPALKMEINRNGELIGSLTKDFTIIRDAYTLDIISEEDAPLFVALTIAVDNIFDRRRRDSRRK